MALRYRNRIMFATIDISDDSLERRTTFQHRVLTYPKRPKTKEEKKKTANVFFMFDVSRSKRSG